MSRMLDIRQKEVINIRDGCRLGFVCDIDIDINTGRILQIIISAECKIWGFLSPQKEYRINWCDIQQIGDDLIIVDICLNDCIFSC